MSVVEEPFEVERLRALERYDILDTLPERAFDRLANIAARLFDAPIALVSLVDERRTWFKACLGVDTREVDNSLSFCVYTIRHDDVLVVQNALEDDRFRGNALVTSDPYLRFYAGAPLVTPDGFKIGSLCVLDTAPRGAISEVQKESLVDLAAMVIDELELRAARLQLEREALDREQLVRSLRDSQDVTNALLGVSNLTRFDLPPSDLARHALDLVVDVADLDWCQLVTLRGDHGSSQAVWARDARVDDMTAPAWHFSRGEGVAWRVANDEQPYFVSSYREEPQAIPALVEMGLEAAAWLPLGTYDGASYVMILGRVRPARLWTTRDENLLEAAARSMRLTLNERERARRMEHAARTDILTNLGNRRAFEEALSDGTARGAYSVAALDLDGLKGVNDSLGHTAGDALLRLFASALSVGLPRDASVYRFGGDEFVVLLPDTHAHVTLNEARDEVLEHLDRAVTAVRAAGFERSGCSFGVARWPDEAETPEEVLLLADERLYADKRARKSRLAIPERRA